jgi:hypothetical protein
MKEESYWNEEWRAFTLPGMKVGELYEVSSHGRVRHFNKKKDTFQYLRTINQFRNKSGFEYVNNFKREKGVDQRVSDSVHRLVAKAFCERPNERHKYVIHKDYNKQNNQFENLKWVTLFDLNIHNNNNPKVQAARANRKGNITHSKLTETDVIRLKKKLKRARNPLYKIAKEFGITHTQLNRIRKGENWGHIKIDDDDNE